MTLVSKKSESAVIIIIIIIIINERHSNIIVLRINFKVAATAKAVGKVKISHAAV